jgi:hypothetical protein
LLLSLAAHVGVPLTALFVVSVIGFQATMPIVEQACRLGTHLCILAIGATGAVLTDPKLLRDLGAEWMAMLSILAVLATVGLAAVAIKVHESKMADILKAAASVFLGLLAVGLISGIIVGSGTTGWEHL